MAQESVIELNVIQFPNKRVATGIAVRKPLVPGHGHGLNRAEGNARLIGELFLL